MMGHQPDFQAKLFYTTFNLDKRVREDHILRRVAEHIDFDFIYKEVKDTYGSKGNVLVSPPVILKMMLLLILYNVGSERELIATIPERLDWLWFLGYDLDSVHPEIGKIAESCPEKRSRNIEVASNRRRYFSHSHKLLAIPWNRAHLSYNVSFRRIWRVNNQAVTERNLCLARVSKFAETMEAQT